MPHDARAGWGFIHIMGQQKNKIEKRRRRKAYERRKNDLLQTAKKVAKKA